MVLRVGLRLAVGVEHLYRAVFVQHRFELGGVAHRDDLQVVRNNVLTRHALHLLGERLKGFAPRHLNLTLDGKDLSGDYIMLEILRESGGVALAIPDAEILASLKDWAANEGIFLSPEGAAATAAYDRLLASGYLKPSDRVVLFNTGSGLKYTDVTAEAMGLKRPAAS